MSLQSRITEYSVMVQYVNPFERDLRSIGTAISKGEALRWKYDNDCYLFTLFNSTLVNREFTFYASHPFYSGNGAKAFSQVPKADESPQSISTNKNIA